VNKNILIIILVSIFSAGCTIVPKPYYIIGSTASFDSSTPAEQPLKQNSGFIGFLKNGNGIITENARQRYNNLVKEYGDKLLDDTGYKIEKDSGIFPIQGDNVLYEIDQQHLFYFILINQWNKQNRT
jgi:hypothetical protein